MNEGGTLIKTATMSAVVKQVSGTAGIEMMDSIRKVGEIAPGNCFAYVAVFND